MSVTTNVFCAAGMHLPNGSFATFGGNGAVAPGGGIGSQVSASGASATYDSTYKDFTGGNAIRILNPCSSGSDFTSTQCEWYDSYGGLQMQKTRWYAGVEPLADGSVVIVGGFVNGGYVNRNYPNTDPTNEGGAAEPTFEFYPSRGDATNMEFMTTTSGLNSYAHMYLMASGKMLVQANTSTILWDYDNNVETPLPDMPNGVVRVYPASGAVAMLPLTPANNYSQTVLFCGGSDMPDEAYGNYSWPFINTFDYPASKDCQRLTAEPADGSDPAYEQDDDMPVGRTMGQFITLPDGTMLIINGAENGTAGYATQTLLTTSYADMPYGMSLSAGPVTQPVIYNPNAAKGSRFSSAGLGTSNIPRLYHSTALLLPDGSVFVAGSNPNVDVNTSTVYPTTYDSEIFYPPYFNSTNRPVPTGMPTTLSYGGSYFNITLPASSYSGSANDAAGNTTVVIHRGGFTTHAMNMGQRLLQLNNTYTVNSDSSITLHVAQPPPNAALFQPGPAMMFTVVNGIPSNGSWLIVGNGEMGDQPTSAASVLPDSQTLASATGSGSGSGSSSASGALASSIRPATGLLAGVASIFAVVALLL